MYAVLAIIAGVLVFFRYSQETSRNQWDSDKERPTRNGSRPTGHADTGADSGIGRQQRNPTFDPMNASKSKRESSFDYQLTVMVSDQGSGMPVEGALVELSRGGEEGAGDALESASTDSRGRTGFDPPPGSYHLSVRHERYIAAFASVESDPVRPALKSIALVPAIAISGFVSDREGLPVPSARILLSSRGEAQAEALSRGDGSFDVWVEPGQHDLTARKAAVGETVMYGIDVWPGRHFIVDVVLVREPSSESLSGRVISDAGMVSDAVVQVDDLSRNSNPGRRFGTLSQPAYRIGFYDSARSDDKGQFSLNLPPGDHCALRIAAPGYELFNELLDRRAGDSKTLKLTKERGFVVTVTDSQGNAVRGLEIVGVNGSGRRVVRQLSRVGYSSSEYPLRIYALDPQTGIRVTPGVQISDYQPEVSLVLRGR